MIGLGCGQGRQAVDGDDSFFLIENMEASVLHSGKGHIDLERLKKMGGRRNARLNSTSLHHKRRQ